MSSDFINEIKGKIQSIDLLCFDMMRKCMATSKDTVLNIYDENECIAATYYIRCSEYIAFVKSNSILCVHIKDIDSKVLCEDVIFLHNCFLEYDCDSTRDYSALLDLDRQSKDTLVSSVHNIYNMLQLKVKLRLAVIPSGISLLNGDLGLQEELHVRFGHRIYGLYYNEYKLLDFDNYMYDPHRRNNYAYLCDAMRAEIDIADLLGADYNYLLGKCLIPMQIRDLTSYNRENFIEELKSCDTFSCEMNEEDISDIVYGVFVTKNIMYIIYRGDNNVTKVADFYFSYTTYDWTEMYKLTFEYFVTCVLGYNFYNAVRSIEIVSNEPEKVDAINELFSKDEKVKGGANAFRNAISKMSE